MRPDKDRLARLRDLSDDEIERAVAADPEAAPLDDGWMDEAEVVEPQSKIPLSIRLDPDVVDYFKSGGPGYQSRINAVLKKYVQAARKAPRQKG